MKFVKDDIIAVIKTIYDPEIPVNIWDLGLIYNIDIKSEGKVHIQMTFTSPTCPMMDEIFEMIVSGVEKITGKNTVSIELVWDPPWGLSMMSQEARLELDLTEDGW